MTTLPSLSIQVLRKPKDFLIALLEKFGQLSQSATPDVSVWGGVGVVCVLCTLMKGCDLCQGEVLETVTTACVCLFTAQPTLSDQVGTI